MFICTIVITAKSIRNIVGMQECINYTILMLPLGVYTIYWFTCTQHALMYFIIYNVNIHAYQGPLASCWKSVVLLHRQAHTTHDITLCICFCHECINPSPIVHCVLYGPRTWITIM